MKILPANLPEPYIRLIEENCLVPCIRPPEHIRIAVRELIRNGYLPSDIPEVDPQQTKNLRFFDYCINCERSIFFPEKRTHFFHKNIEVFKLYFCCDCYEQFKDKSFDDFPEDLINKIQRKLKAYKIECFKDQKYN